MSAANRKRLFTYPILAFAIFGLAFATACGSTNAEAAAQDRVCGVVDTLTTDPAWVNIGQAIPDNMQVIHFTDGRILRTPHVPPTELMKGNSYIFSVGGIQQYDQKTFYFLTGAVSKVSSCDSIPKAPAKK